MKHKVKHVHFVGIGGAGMCGIAEVLLNLGYVVSGSDLVDNAVTRRLKSLGAQVSMGHAAQQVEGADAVVTSSAVRDDNPEVVAARAAKTPVVPRALMLAELMRLKQGIAIAGTHGKSTTTAMTSWVGIRCGLDPSVIVGATHEMSPISSDPPETGSSGGPSTPSSSVASPVISSTSTPRSRKIWAALGSILSLMRTLGMVHLVTPGWPGLWNGDRSPARRPGQVRKDQAVLAVA